MTACAAFLAALDLGCERGPAAPRVVVYASLDEHYARPVLREFERRTGVRVLERYDTEADKTTGLYQRLLAERPRPQADLFWNSEVLRTAALAREGILGALPAASAAALPAAYRDPEGRWCGFAARARVLLYNTRRLPAAEAPRSLADLADPRFRDRAGLALPLFGTSATHAGALRAVLGKAAMEDLFRRFRANGVRVVNGNAVVRDLVVSGELWLGLTDTDDAHEAIRAGREVALVFPDQDVPFPGRAEPLGAFLIPNTVGIVSGGPNPEPARRLAEFLLSAEVEEMLARSGSAQIPLRPGLEPPAGLRLPPQLRAMEVDYAAAERALEEAEPFLRELFVR